MLEYRIGKEKIEAVDEQGQCLAEITFPGGCINRTYVSTVLRGQGVAGILVDMALEEIRRLGLPLSATCSYANAYLHKKGIL